MLESLLVALIVVAAALYALWALTPASVRNGFALRIAHRWEARRHQDCAGAWPNRCNALRTSRQGAAATAVPANAARRAPRNIPSRTDTHVPSMQPIP